MPVLVMGIVTAGVMSEAVCVGVPPYTMVRLCRSWRNRSDECRRTQCQRSDTGRNRTKRPTQRK